MKQQLRRRGWILAMGSNANTNVDKLTAFGQMALEQGWYDQAREYFDQALDLAPLNQEAIEGLTQIDEILKRRASFEPAEAKIPAVKPAQPEKSEEEERQRKKAKTYRETYREKWEEWYHNREEKRGKEEERQKRVEEGAKQGKELTIILSNPSLTNGE